MVATVAMSRGARSEPAHHDHLGRTTEQRRAEDHDGQDDEVVDALGQDELERDDRGDRRRAGPGRS